MSSTVEKREFGSTSDTNDGVALFTITNSRSARVELIEYGASIRSLWIPDKNGRSVDVVLGYETLDGYEKGDAYLGCVVGRVANRIENGQFTIDGRTYRLPTNNGPNHLHGGRRGFGQRLWKTKEIGSDFVRFEYESADGEEEYPSRVRASVTYRLSSSSDPESPIKLCIELEATNIGGKCTPVNLTSHPYFNLGGVDRPSADIRDHRLTIFSDHYLPVDRNHLVTGEIRSVDGTLYDFRSPALLGDRLNRMPEPGGYDGHFCNSASPKPRPLAVLECPSTTGIRMTLSSTQPGFQIYTAQYMNESGAKYSRAYGKYNGIAMEAQQYPDAVNKPHFPPIWLEPGGVMRSSIVYEFTVV